MAIAGLTNEPAQLLPSLSWWVQGGNHELLVLRSRGHRNGESGQRVFRFMPSHALVPRWLLGKGEDTFSRLNPQPEIPARFHLQTKEVEMKCHFCNQPIEDNSIQRTVSVRFAYTEVCLHFHEDAPDCWNASKHDFLAYVAKHNFLGLTIDTPRRRWNVEQILCHICQKPFLEYSHFVSVRIDYGTFQCNYRFHDASDTDCWHKSKDVFLKITVPQHFQSLSIIETRGWYALWFLSEGHQAKRKNPRGCRWCWRRTNS